MTTPQSNTYEVTIKSVPAINVVSLQEAVDDFETSSATNIRLFDTLRERMSANNLAFSNHDIAVYHGIPTVTPLAIEATIETDVTPTDAVDVQFKTLPAVEQMASVTLYGGFENYGVAMQALMQWIASNGYQVVGDMRDVYHVFDKNGDPNTFVTELQFPIAPAQ